MGGTNRGRRLVGRERRGSGPTGAPVPVSEWMDGLELGVGDHGPHRSRIIVSVGIEREVLDESPDALGRWRLG